MIEKEVSGLLSLHPEIFHRFTSEQADQDISLPRSPESIVRSDSLSGRGELRHR
jgi:hypothetical protein